MTTPNNKPGRAWYDVRGWIQTPKPEPESESESEPEPESKSEPKSEPKQKPYETKVEGEEFTPSDALMEESKKIEKELLHTSKKLQQATEELTEKTKQVKDLETKVNALSNKSKRSKQLRTLGMAMTAVALIGGGLVGGVYAYRKYSRMNQPMKTKTPSMKIYIPENLEDVNRTSRRRKSSPHI